MSYGRGDQIETHMRHRSRNGEAKTSGRWLKVQKHRKERYRVKTNPECFPAYNRFGGWEY